jgi:branched-chain amino acid transport system permease protein
MAVVLVMRPNGLLGRALVTPRVQAPAVVGPMAPQPRWIFGIVILLAVVPLAADRYSIVLLNDILVFALFAASLQFLMGTGGMISFGHAAYFGIGAYAAALLLKRAGLPMEAALALAPLAGGIAALFFGWFCVRLAGVYLAMLTLAFAQITWSIAFQWGEVTGGSNGMIGVWPATWLSNKSMFYWLTLAITVIAVLWLWRLAASPFGYALRAGRDSPLRAEAVGIDVRYRQWLAFGVVGTFAAVAGALYAFSKGSISPDVMGIPRSVDALVMVLLGGVQSLMGPLVGAAVLTWLQDEIIRDTDYWRGILGLVILALVLAFPQGLAGARIMLRRRRAP